MSSSRRSAWYMSNVASLRLRREYKPKWLSGPRYRNTCKGSSSVNSSGVSLPRKSCSKSLKIDSSAWSWSSPKASCALMPSCVQRRAWTGTLACWPGRRFGRVARKCANSSQEGSACNTGSRFEWACGEAASWAVSSSTLLCRATFLALQASSCTSLSASSCWQSEVWEVSSTTLLCSSAVQSPHTGERMPLPLHAHCSQDCPRHRSHSKMVLPFPLPPSLQDPHSSVSQYLQHLMPQDSHSRTSHWSHILMAGPLLLPRHRRQHRVWHRSHSKIPSHWLPVLSLQRQHSCLWQ